MELNDLEGEIHTRNAQREKLQKSLLAAASNLPNTRAFKDDTLESILLFCESLLEDIEKRKKEREKLLDKEKDLSDNLKTARQQEDAAREESANWEDRWRECASLFIKTESRSPKTLSLIEPEEVNDTIENLQGCFQKLKEADELHKRIEGIDRDAVEFAAEVRQLVKKAAPELEAHDPKQAVLQLQKLLKENLERKTLLRKYGREIEEAKKHINVAEESILVAETRIGELKRIAGCNDADDLEEVERLAREQLDLKIKCRETEAALLTGAGGLSISRLESQAAMFNPDELPGKIDTLNREIEQHLEPEIRRLSEDSGREEKGTATDGRQCKSRGSGPFRRANPCGHSTNERTFHSAQSGVNHFETGD